MPALGDNPLFLGCADYRSTIASNGESSGFTFPEEMRRHADKGTALVTDKEPGDAEIAEVVSRALSSQLHRAGHLQRSHPARPAAPG